MTDTQNANELFERENGMTVDEAYQYVQRWKFEGKKQEAIRGCKEILKFFPDHEGAKTILVQFGGLDARIEQTGGKIIDKVSDKLHGMMHKEEAPQSEQPQEKNVPPVDTEQITESAENIQASSNQENEETVAPISDLSSQKEEENIRIAEQRLTTNDERNWAAISYAWVFVLIPLLMKKYENSLYVKFHLKQGLVLFLIFFFFEWLIVNILSFLFGSAIAYFSHTLVFVLFGAMAFMAWQGKWFRIPLVYKLSKKIPL